MKNFIKILTLLLMVGAYQTQAMQRARNTFGRNVSRIRIRPTLRQALRNIRIPKYTKKDINTTPTAPTKLHRENIDISGIRASKNHIIDPLKFEPTLDGEDFRVFENKQLPKETISKPIAAAALVITAIKEEMQQASAAQTSIEPSALQISETARALEQLTKQAEELPLYGPAELMSPMEHLEFEDTTNNQQDEKCAQPAQDKSMPIAPKDQKIYTQQMPVVKNRTRKTEQPNKITPAQPTIYYTITSPEEKPRRGLPIRTQKKPHYAPTIAQEQGAQPVQDVNMSAPMPRIPSNNIYKATQEYQPTSMPNDLPIQRPENIQPGMQGTPVTMPHLPLITLARL